jgi:carboxyl-terminal processing protease
MKHMRHNILLFSLVLSFKVGLPQNDNCKQMRLFEKLWTKIDENYASFEIKAINWQESYKEFKPKITADLTQEQLIDTIEMMLKPFNDGHVGLVKLKLFPLRIAKGFSAERESFFYNEFPNDSLRTLLFEATNSSLIQYGFDSLPFGYNSDKNILDYSTSNDVGYIHVSHMEGIGIRKTRLLMREFLKKCQGFNAIIIDVRDNQGGLAKVGDQIAGAFLDNKKQVSNDYKRKGKNHDSFSKPKPYYCKQFSKNPFTGTVIILTNDRTRSAGENFVMSLMDLPNVTIIGDRTEGILGEAKIGFLPYGWVYAVNNYKILSPDGINYEDIGIPPDYLIQNKISDISQKKDPLIEKAITLITVKKSTKDE